jgi:hypothetical protein
MNPRVGILTLKISNFPTIVIPSEVESLPCFAEALSEAEGEVEGNLLFVCIATSTNRDRASNANVVVCDSGRAPTLSHRSERMGHPPTGMEQTGWANRPT